MDKELKMRCKIEAVFEHYAEQSEYYRRANVAAIYRGAKIWSCPY